ncbi:MAG: hypothetical protein RBS82_13590, partial [Syntrophales bacterium]|nr:hypothetical protein [Syntrophales bacterium]
SMLYIKLNKIELECRAWSNSRATAPLHVASERLKECLAQIKKTCFFMKPIAGGYRPDLFDLPLL